MAIRSTEHLVSRAGLWLVTACGLAFLLGPIVVIVPLSFNAEAFFSYPMPGLSLRWYETLVGSEAWRRALFNSLFVGFASTVLATALGSAAAYGVLRLRPAWKSACIAVLISPMIVPGVVVALALYLSFGRIGLAGTFAGIILAHTLLALPFVVLIVTAALAGLDANLVRAAASLGASPLVAFRRVVLPIVSPALASGALFAFVTSFDEFIVTSFLAAPEQTTLPLQMWSGVHDDVTPTILAAATLFVVASAAMLLAVEQLRRRAARLGLRT